MSSEGAAIVLEARGGGGQYVFSTSTAVACSRFRREPLVVVSHLLLVRVGLHDQAQIGLRLELLQGEVCERHAVSAVDVLVLVLDRSVYDEEAVEVHEDAAARGALALAVVLRRREDGEYLRRGVPNETAALQA